MCWGAKWHGKRGVLYDSLQHSKPEDMVYGVWELLNEADAVCHYNGTRFDIPTLNKEFLLHGLAPPEPYKQIDLLKTCKRVFRFPSNKLDYVAQALGVGAKVKHIGHELWLGCMYDNDPASWRTMERYNKMDVKLLEKLYNRLLPWIVDHPNVALYNGKDRPSCPQCGGTNVISQGTAKTKTHIYRKFQCKDCGSWSRSRLNCTENKESVLAKAG